MIIKTNDYTPDLLSRHEEEGITMFKGLVKLDRNNLICIASRPGMGKTSLALHVALEYAMKSNRTVYIFSLEMFAEQIYSRMLCYLAQVDSYSMRKKEFTPEESERIAAAVSTLGRLDIVIDDEPLHTVKQIEEKLSDIDGLGLVVIDYLQLLHADTEYGGCDGISRPLKLLARGKNIPIVITSQLRRDIEYREDKRPTLSDLGKIEGVGEGNLDTVIFPYREEYYECSVEGEDHSEVEIIISKNRYDSVGSLRYKWQGRYMKFSE